MANIGILLLIIVVSSLPAVAAFAWFRLARYPFAARLFLAALFAGATSPFVAIALQNFVSLLGILPPMSGRSGLFAEIFVRIAFTEELARLLLLVPVFLAFARFDPEKLSPPGVSEQTMGMACGFVVGLGFGIFEGAAYGTADPVNALLRIVSATPLHAACGSRIGAAATTFRRQPVQAVFRFFSAVAIHGLYNLLIVTPGRISPMVAVLAAFLALASSARTISVGMRGEETGIGEPPIK